MSLEHYTAYLPFFGDVQAFLPHLRRIKSELAEKCPTLKVKVLTDLDTVIPLDGIQLVRFEPNQSIIREKSHPGWAFDYKAALVVQLLKSEPSDDIIVLDIDNFIRRDFSEVLAQIPRSACIAMPPSPGEPYSKPIELSDSTTRPEHTSSFMVFQGGIAGHAIASIFSLVSNDLVLSEKEHYLREQRVWSIVFAHHERLGMAHLLPRTMGWSRFWNPKEPADTYIRHMHGKEKWR